MNKRPFVMFTVRFVRIIGLTILAVLRMIPVAVVSGRTARADRLAAEVVRLLESLGGAFIKVGQLAATRVDLVGPVVAKALSRLHDNVRPMTSDQAMHAVRRDFPCLPDRFASALGEPPVASGSIASVYCVRLEDRTLALKVLRPEIGAAITADMRILRALAGVAGRLPRLRRVPMVEIVDQVGECLVKQLDFDAEADNLRRMRELLMDAPGILVPAVVPEYCGRSVIAMEFVPDLTHASIAALSEQLREAEVGQLVRAVYRLLFIDGFVHVDLHQGNTYFKPDGTVVLLDAGFAFQMTPTARLRYTEFFGGMIRGDGEACAEILLSTVQGVTAGADIDEFRRHVAALVVRNAGAAARDFNLPAFCMELFNLQRRHGLYADPEFIFPMLCLLSLDGLVKENYPLMDFQLEAAPYVMHSLLCELETTR